MGWNERSDPDMRTANFCDVYREGVYMPRGIIHNYSMSANFSISLLDTDTAYTTYTAKNLLEF